MEEIKPTTSAAERALQWQKISYSTDGSRFVENILSIVATCRQQGRSVTGVSHTRAT